MWPHQRTPVFTARPPAEAKGTWATAAARWGPAASASFESRDSKASLRGSLRCLSPSGALRSFADVDDAERLRLYRRFVYEIGSVPTAEGASISEETIQTEERRDFAITAVDRFRSRTRYFTDSGVIGTKRFVADCYRRFEDHFACKHPKRPHPVGIEGVFSLKRLRKAT